MCGINGFTWSDEALIHRMNHVSRYRGPDDQGIYVDERVSLGTVRLAVIDPSENGHQPMSNEDDEIWISYNGEIYNFREIRGELLQDHIFKSLTDTEVAIHAYETYGLDCFEKFNGMWGFAIYDKRKSELILCRDRFGIKPVYYRFDEQGMIFSSMIGAILEHPFERRVNERNMMDYLAFNLQQHNKYTFFEDVYSLMPGHFLIYDLNTGIHRVERWYTPEPRSFGNLSDLKDIFVKSVERRTISDVPIGVTLSGGIDSSAITGALDDCLMEKFRTYSLVVPGSPIDEKQYIEEVVKHTNTEPFFTTIEPETALNDLNDFVFAMEEPVSGLSVYSQYIVFKLAHQKKAKVILDGQGGDELFAGYVYYYGYYFYELFSRFKWIRLLKELVLSYMKLKDPFPHAMFAFMLMPAKLRHALWKRNVAPWVDHAFLEQVCGEEKDPRWNRMDVKENLKTSLLSTSIPHNLMWQDKSSMRWSVESRVPFMDVNMVEAALSVGTEQLLGKGETKRLFKDAVADLLPDMIRHRTDKIGFEAPEDDFFRDERVVAFTKDIIYSDSFKARPYWNWSAIENIFMAHLAGRTNAGQNIWKWINTELWIRTFIKQQ